MVYFIHKKCYHFINIEMGIISITSLFYGEELIYEKD